MVNDIVTVRTVPRPEKRRKEKARKARETRKRLKGSIGQDSTCSSRTPTQK